MLESCWLAATWEFMVAISSDKQRTFNREEEMRSNKRNAVNAHNARWDKSLSPYKEETKLPQIGTLSERVRSDRPQTESDIGVG